MQYGYDFTKVTADAIADVVAGRWIHIDADFLSYHAGLPDDNGNLRPIDDCVDQLLVQADTLRALACAESMHLHFTHPDSTKGGRYDAAIQQPYQNNRAKDYTDEELQQKAHVGAIRIATVERFKETDKYHEVTVKASITSTYEADDTLSWAMNADSAAVLSSGDKDLCMVAGMHLTEPDFLIRKVQGYGSCWLDTSKSSPKVRGYGTSFFWHQMLMGDNADHIKGLITISSEDLNEFFPTKASIEGLRRREAGEPLTKAQEKGLSRAPSSCGPVKAYTLLEGCKTDLDALRRVKQLYSNTYGADWQRIFWSEAHMLWMTRYEGDVVQNFINEVIQNG